MHTRLVCICCLVSLLWCTASRAELSTDQYAFSSLLTQSDLVVKGYVQRVDEDDVQWHQVTFNVEEVLKGSAGTDVVQIGTTKGKRGGRIAHNVYLWASPLRLVLFLSFDETASLWRIVNGEAGRLRADAVPDIRMLVQAYKANTALFSNAGSGTLKTLFEASQNRDVKSRLLYDLEDVLTSQDVTFLSRLLDSPQETEVIFGALMAGRIKVEALRPRVESLLTTSASRRIKFHCIVALGNLANPDSRQQVLSFLNDPDPGTRRVAIEAVGKISGREIIEPLKASYALETDIGHRLAIITAVSRLSDQEVARDAFRGFHSIETNPIAISILDRKLNVEE